ncbi:MAG: hypothetical protein JWN35_2531 [Frankiales bacterium]|jgi:hypothetical protein|nr:hypothetical protein [Frankiales bacterium]
MSTPEAPPVSGAVPGHVPPRFRAPAYTCPFCAVFAQQHWGALLRGAAGSADSGVEESRCAHCSGSAFWLRDTAQLLWPATRAGQPAHPEMPVAARQLYDEARSAATASPRAAVALLRLAVDVLMREVVPGSRDKPLAAVIGQATSMGLTHGVRVALDVLRAHGSDAAHPVQLILNEADAAGKIAGLCTQLNLVVEQLVSIPRQQREALASMPESVRRQIEKSGGGLPDFVSRAG